MPDIKIASVRLAGNPKKSSIIEIFIAEPPANKEFLAGKLFILTEIQGEKKYAEKINAFLIDRINYFFYENDKILLREKISSLRPEHIFETALAKANKAFQDFLKSEKIRFDAGALNIAVGLSYQTEIHFSLSGNNKVFLIYRQNAWDSEKSEYKLAELSKGNEISEKTIFSNILSGACPEKGGVMICNEAMSEYLSSQQIIKIISALPPLSATEQIRQLLEKMNNYIAFGAIIIKENRVSSIAREDVQAKPILPASDSIRRLNLTEDKTERLLSSSGIFSLKNFILKILPKNQANKPETIILRDRLYARKRLLGLSRNTLSNLASYPTNLFLYLAKSLARCGLIGRLLAWPKKFPAWQLPDFIKKRLIFDRKKKALLAIFLLAAIFLVISLNRGKKAQEEAAQIEAYQGRVDEIEKMQNQIDANLLYNNEEGAKKLFDEINQQIAGLPQETEEQKKIYDDFNRRFTAQLNSVRRITVIDEPELLADFSKINSQAGASNLALVGQKIYAADPKNGIFYIIDLADRAVTALAQLNQAVDSALHPAQSDQSLYYFNKQNFLEIKTGDNSLSELSWNSASPAENIIAIGAFNARLYVLDRGQGQIFRFNRAGSSFGSAYAWLSEKTDFSEAIDMFIDGNVYVLEKNGLAAKFLRGEKQDFSLRGLDPGLESPTKLSGLKDKNVLFVLDPPSQRLALFNKDGNFLIQYQSPAFTGLTDLAADEEKGLIYILADNKVYLIDSDQF